MEKLRILLAKGRIYESVYELLSDVGISIKLPDRTYFPTTNQKDLAFQVVKPQITSWLLANNKAEDLSIKKLTKNSPIMRARFEQLRETEDAGSLGSTD